MKKTSDKSAWVLLLSNLITIAIAVIQKWDLAPLLIIYWAQSVIIGISNWRRILNLRQFSTKNFTINKVSVDPTQKTKRRVAWFFLFHYGFFHFVYFIFISAMIPTLSNFVWMGIAVGILIFAINHYYSYKHNLERDSARVPNIGTLMFFPYARILPMHLTIIFGGAFSKGSTISLLIFLSLKTGADLIMHWVEHSKLK
ncbi:MAG: hypothetical protein GXO87_01800 [Chlorobi bacterium]|nr:hypothetical protein [Chlorobiota bacterium]